MSDLDMRITQVQPLRLGVPALKDASAPPQDVFLVQVQAGALTAYGEAWAEEPADLADGIELLAPSLTGLSPLDRGVLWERMQETLADPDIDGALYQGVLSALDVALWDIAAQALGIPVYQLLGGAYYRLLDCYCVARTAADIDKLLQRSRDLLSAGYGALCLELSGDVAADCELIALIRKTFGGSVRLLFDACERYTTSDAALEVGAAVDRAEGFWFARPLPEGDWEAYAALRDPLATPLAAGASLTSAQEADAALRLHALDMVTLDLRRCGGITGAARIAQLAGLHAARVTATPSQCPLTTVAAAHVCVATPASVLFPSTAGIPRSWKEMLSTPLSYAGGFLRLAETPGLGAAISEQFLADYTVES